MRSGAISPRSRICRAAKSCSRQKTCPGGIATGEGRQGPKHWLHDPRIIQNGSVGRLDAPDREHDMAVYAVAPLDGIENVGPFGEACSGPC